MLITINYPKVIIIPKGATISDLQRNSSGYTIITPGANVFMPGEIYPVSQYRGNCIGLAKIISATQYLDNDGGVKTTITFSKLNASDKVLASYSRVLNLTVDMEKDSIGMDDYQKAKDDFIPGSIGYDDLSNLRPRDSDKPRASNRSEDFKYIW